MRWRSNRFQRAVSFLLICFILTSCAGEGEKDVDALRDISYWERKEVQKPELTLPGTTAKVVRSGNMGVTLPNGVLFMEMQGEGTNILFSDWEVSEIYPVCPKANCLHDNADCTAWFPFEDGTPGYFYVLDGQIYFLLQNDSVSLYRQDLDGSNRTKLLDFSDDTPDSFSAYVDGDAVYDGTYAYYTVCMDSLKNGDYLCQIWRVDLEHAKVEKLGLRTEKKTSMLYLQGKYRECLVLTYRQYDSSFEKAKDTALVYNPETEEYSGFMKSVSPEEVMCFGNSEDYGVWGYVKAKTDQGVTVSWEDREYTVYPVQWTIVDFETNTEYVLPEMEAGWELSFADNKVFYYTLNEDRTSLKHCAYDLASWQEIELPKGSGEFSVVSEIGDDFICAGREDAESGSIYYRIKKEDYYAGTPQPVLLERYF